MTKRDVAAERRSDHVREYKRYMIGTAAKTVVAEHGIGGASMLQIASQAGKTTGAIYQYFESKEDLYPAPRCSVTR